MSVPATFVHSNVYDLPANLDGQFDIVFTSHGVIGWLPDLDAWAKVIAHFLKPGGVFCIIEATRLRGSSTIAAQEPELRLLYPYFHGPRTDT